MAEFRIEGCQFRAVWSRVLETAKVCYNKIKERNVVSDGTNKKQGGIVGVNFIGMLFLVFLALKLADKIDWSWWWVFAPLWVPVLLSIVIVGLAAIVAIVSAQREKKRQR